MSLMPGTRLGPYEVIAPIGAGGMGEVYRARDSRLDRDVAIKVLPEAFAADSDRRARFEREAKAVAALSHPNILAVFDTGLHGDQLYVVMELLYGETLRARLQAGALPVRKAIEIAVQIARGLAAAHDKGIVHRDLKPENVFVLSGGQVKILDFGLARVVSRSTDASETVAATDAGTVLGTVEYMAPEQVRGQAVDARADLFALGAVLYEMLSGRHAFQRDTPAETMTAILREDVPDLQLAGRTDLSRALDRIVRHCLERDPTERFQTARDVAFTLQGVDPLAISPPRLGTGLSWTAAGIFGLVGLSAVGWGITRQPVSEGIQARLIVQLPPNITIPMNTEHPVLALSPDGRLLVFVGEERGTRRLYQRWLADSAVTPIDGTDGAADPFFSPDGTWITYFRGETLAKVAVNGGASLSVHRTTPATVNRGATWLNPTQLLYAASPNSGLVQSEAIEGELRDFNEWTYATNEINKPYAWPSAMPNGRQVLFTEVIGNGPDQSRISLLNVADRTVQTLINGGSFGRFSATNHVLFTRAGALYALPFDADGARATGIESKLLDDVVVEPNGAAHYALSGNGLLAYVAGPTVRRETELILVDRSGKLVATLMDDGREYSFPRLSPDGKQVAVTIPTGSNYDVWIHNLASGTDNKITTGPGEDFEPVWSPDGTRLAIASEDDDEEGPGLAWMNVGDHKLEFLLRTPGIGNWEFPTSWSPDGRWLAFTRNRVGAGSDVELMPTNGERKPVPFAAEAASESGAMFNPNEGLIAYVSDKSGRDEVYVRPFPGSGREVTISSGGGTEPAWSRDGRELFFRQGNSLWSARLTVSETFSRSAPVFHGTFEAVPYGGRSANYDVSIDSQRFVVVRLKNLPQPRTIQVVLDWSRTLTSRMSTP